MLLEGDLLELTLDGRVQSRVVDADGGLIGNHPDQGLLQLGERLDPFAGEG